MGKMVGVAEFKANCEQLLAQMAEDGESIELTEAGKVVGVVSPPLPTAPAEAPPGAFGMLESDAYRDVDPEDFAVDPDWEAKWDAKWADRAAAPLEP